MFVVCLSGRAREFKRNAKSCILFVYPEGPESLKKGKTLFIVCLSDRAGKFIRGKKLLIGYLSGRARKFKRKAKSCLLFVYTAGPGNLKEAKSYNCLFIWHGREV